MKKIIIILLSSFLTSYFLLPTSARATSPTPTSEINSDTINSLKERIASRVAQLKLVERRGIFGKVIERTDTQITLSDLRDETRFVDVDELTKFSSPSAKEAFGISDISKNSSLSVLGLYNKQSRRLLARFVSVVNLPKFIHGTIISTDLENYTADILSNDNQTFTADIENLTKTLAYTENSLQKSGFSKIKKGEHAIIVGYQYLSDKKRITATRVLRFPDIPANPEIKVNIPEETATPTPTSSQSVNSNPTSKVTPTK